MNVKGTPSKAGRKRPLDNGFSPLSPVSNLTPKSAISLTPSKQNRKAPIEMTVCYFNDIPIVILIGNGYPM